MDVHSNPKSLALPTGCEMTFSLLGMATCVNLLPWRLLGNARISYSLGCHSEPSLLQELPLTTPIFYLGGLQLHNLHFGTAICLAPCQQGWQYGTHVIASLAYSVLARPMPYCWESGVNWYFWECLVNSPHLSFKLVKKKKKWSLVLSKSHSK